VLEYFIPELSELREDRWEPAESFYVQSLLDALEDPVEHLSTLWLTLTITVVVNLSIVVDSEAALGLFAALPLGIID
jgi:hypothetical protein